MTIQAATQSRALVFDFSVALVDAAEAVLVLLVAIFYLLFESLQKVKCFVTRALNGADDTVCFRILRLLHLLFDDAAVLSLILLALVQRRVLAAAGTRELVYYVAERALPFVEGRFSLGIAGLLHKYFLKLDLLGHAFVALLV